MSSGPLDHVVTLCRVTEAATFALRASRGTVFAAVALALAAGGHVIGGGSAPGLLTLVGLSLPVLWISFFLTLKRRRWPSITGALIVVQTGLHAGLMWLSAPMSGAGSLRAVPPGDGLMAAHGASLEPAAPLISHGTTTGMALVPSPGMIAAHVIATVLTGALLTHGESLLWSLWNWLRRSIRAASVVTVAFPVERRACAWTSTINPIPALVDRSVRRRGPPGNGFRPAVFV